MTVNNYVCEYERLRALLPSSEMWLRGALGQHGYKTGKDGLGNIWPSEGMLTLLIEKYLDFGDSIG